MLDRMRQESAKHLTHGRRGRWDGAGVMLDAPGSNDRLDLRAAFGRGGLVEVEIGTGKGTFLLARAAARPDVNFLGIEYAGAYCHYAADRIRRAGLSNVRMLQADAGHVFRAAMPEGGLWRVHVYFPDPWPKRRHHRRRLIQPPFADDARRALLPGGQLLIVTDHLDYFRQIAAVLYRARGWATCPFPSLTDATGEIVGTNFERKYIAEGRAFHAAARMKLAAR